jgi:8-oxo-dGTP diphosphatase
MNLNPVLDKKRTIAVVSAYLILKRDHNVLLLLRQNTGYCDGQWGLVSGHVEENESAMHGMIREAKEEADLELLPSQLKIVHVMHRKEKRLNIDIFFECTAWQGTPVNREPEKCAALEFFLLADLPVKTIPYIATALQAANRGNFYSEYGWENSDL